MEKKYMNYVMIYIYINNENLGADKMAIYYERLCMLWNKLSGWSNTWRL